MNSSPVLAEALPGTRLVPGETKQPGLLVDSPRTSLTVRKAASLTSRMQLLPGLLPDGTRSRWPIEMPTDPEASPGVGFDLRIHTANV